MSYRTLLAGLILTASALTIPCASAMARPGYGYGDPRSAQLDKATALAALPGGRFLLSRKSGVVLKYVPGRELKWVGGSGHKPKAGGEPGDAREVSLFPLYDVEPYADGGFVAASSDVIAIRDGRAVKIAKTFSAGLAVAEDGSVLAAPFFGARIIEIAPSGEQSTVAGAGEFGLAPDGSVAAQSPVLEINDIKYTPDGGFVFAETDNHYAAIRKVSSDGRITTLAGGDRLGFAGDGGPAVDATLSDPRDIDVASDGSILIADGRRIRRIDPGGTITTVAGTGEGGYNGDGMTATDANLGGRLTVAAHDDGSFLVGDFGGGGVDRVRRVSPAGTIRTVAGMPAPIICDDAPYNGIQGGPGNERLEGGDLRDLIRGETGESRLLGRDGSDCLVGGTVDDVITGGPGGDVVVAENGDDEVTGDDGNDSVFGYDGEDVITGGEGRDEIYGGHADDSLDGGPGNDHLSGYDGADRINGGGGDDYVDAQLNEKESFSGLVDIVSCGPGEDTVKANTYDRVDKNCEHLTGAIAGNAPD